jgi:hypothetical protein
LGKEEWVLMGTPKAITNGITRGLLDDIIKNFDVGTEFVSADISTLLSTRRRSVSPRVLGNLLSERRDLKLKKSGGCYSVGVWKKVKESNDV